MRVAISVLCGFLICISPAFAADPSLVEPEALAALNKMGAYLRTLKSFEVKTDTLTDAVMDNGQKVQFAGSVDYKVRRPDGFAITVSDDRRVRQFLYDGKHFTVFAPRMGFYATVPAKPTIREVLQTAYDRFDIELPLADLFRWGTPDDRHEGISSGVVVGYARINGVDADQYAFRQGDIDWQIWIQRGDKPLPLKAVVTDTSDSAMPDYVAVLHWTPVAQFDKAAFVFTPPKDAKSITIASR